MGLNKRYSSAFKQKVVSEIESGKFSVGEVNRVYEIGGGTTVYKWLRRYGKGHLINKTVLVQMKNESDRIKQLEKEKRELEAALAKTQVRVIVLESVIDAAEQELKIDIKKSLACNCRACQGTNEGLGEADRSERSLPGIGLPSSKLL